MSLSLLIWIQEVFIMFSLNGHFHAEAYKATCDGAWHSKKMKNPLFVIHSRALTRYHPFFHKERCLWISEKHSLFRDVRFELYSSVGAVLNASISRQTRLVQECRMEGYISKSFMMVISPVSEHRPWGGRQGWGEKLSREERRGSVQYSGRPGCHLLLHGGDTCWDHCLKGPHRQECTACAHTNTQAHIGHKMKNLSCSKPCAGMKHSYVEDRLYVAILTNIKESQEMNTFHTFSSQKSWSISALFHYFHTVFHSTLNCFELLIDYGFHLHHQNLFLLHCF